jgi:hypothetical protein
VVAAFGEPGEGNALAWLLLLDSGKYVQSSIERSFQIQKDLPVATWVSNHLQRRDPLGAVISREFLGMKKTNSPEKSNIIFSFKTKFQAKTAIETVYFILDADKVWKPEHYGFEIATEEMEKTFSSIAYGTALKEGAEFRKTQLEVDSAFRSAVTWLSILDSGQYAKSHAMASELFKKSVTLAQWEKGVTEARKPFGKWPSRNWKTSSFAKILPGVPAGEYQVLIFETDFSEKKGVIETVTFVKEKDNTWKAAGYFIRPADSVAPVAPPASVPAKKI